MFIISICEGSLENYSTVECLLLQNHLCEFFMAMQMELEAVKWEEEQTKNDANQFATACVSQEYTDLLDRKIYRDISRHLPLKKLNGHLSFIFKVPLCDTGLFHLALWSTYRKRHIQGLLMTEQSF